MTTYDDILEEIGQFGRCQKRIVALFCLVSMPFPCAYVGIVFQGFTPEHWCRDPGVSQIGEHCGWSLQDTRRVTVPLVNTSAGVGYSQCERYNIDWNSTDLTCDHPEGETSPARRLGSPVSACTDGWVYDYEGRQSFVTEVSVWITKLIIVFEVIGRNRVRCQCLMCVTV